MLKKKERLTRKEFDRSFSVGKRLHSPYLQLIYEESALPHGSVVVGKKVAKKAVDRNRLRRRIYGVLYEFQKKEPRPLTIILIAKPGLFTLQRSVVSQQVRELLQRLPGA
jgi:ribonuclease P protein component